jgi:hypothetical protein
LNWQRYIGFKGNEKKLFPSGEEDLQVVGRRICRLWGGGLVGHGEEDLQVVGRRICSLVYSMKIRIGLADQYASGKLQQQRPVQTKVCGKT